MMHGRKNIKFFYLVWCCSGRLNFFMFIHIALCRKANGLTEDEVGKVLAGKLQSVCFWFVEVQN
jgi:hypothetical protein